MMPHCWVFQTPGLSTESLSFEQLLHSAALEILLRRSSVKIIAKEHIGHQAIYP